jgi:hypothetical protein
MIFELILIKVKEFELQKKSFFQLAITLWMIFAQYLECESSAEHSMNRIITITITIIIKNE